MADEEQNNQTEEETTEETSEGDAGETTAGPVAEDGPPADTPEDAPSTPPADEDAGQPEEAPSEDASPAEGAEDEPAAEAEDGEDELAELPWKQRRRLLRSREPSEARGQRSPEERQAERAQERSAAGAARRRYRQSRRGKSETGTGTPPAERHPNAPKVRQGIVVSDKPDKTIIVRIDITRRHPTYEKIVRRSRTLHAHDERNEAGQGDTVRVVETRPLSRSKRWRLVEVIEKAR
jgi:small subunit ribosomal protein S17